MQQHLRGLVAVDPRHPLRGHASGRPMKNSRPSGSATSSAKNRPSVRRCGSTRRISSPSYQPSVIRGSRAASPAPTPAPARDGRGDPVEVDEVGEAERRVDRAQPGLVRQQLAHRDVLLAVRGELRPVARHRRVVVEQPAAVRDGDRHRGDALRGREHRDQRVLLPRRRGSRRRGSRPTGPRPCGRRGRRRRPPRSRGARRSSGGTRRRRGRTRRRRRPAPSPPERRPSAPRDRRPVRQSRSTTRKRLPSGSRNVNIGGT